MSDIQWSPNQKQTYTPRCAAFLMRPLTTELLDSMREELARPLPSYRFLRDIECYMYDREVQLKEELRELVLYAEMVLEGVDV
jgi:hypothetical protein